MPLSTQGATLSPAHGQSSKSGPHRDVASLADIRTRRPRLRAGRRRLARRDQRRALPRFHLRRRRERARPCAPHVAQAIAEQAAKLIHVSNLFRIPEGERLAERLCAVSGFAEHAFFCNSGAEAMEGAIKCARKYHAVNGAPERVRIITFEGAFHGRTLAALAAGGQKKYLEGFGPVVEGFDQVPFGDLAAVKRAIGPTTAAILIEPIQGEGGGVHVVDNQYLRELREL